MFLCKAAYAVDLITEDDANLPTTPRIVSRGGITRGLSIKVVSPDPNGQIKPPFAMNVRFQAHGASKIEPSSVKVTYLKKPVVDLTPRVNRSTSPTPTAARKSEMLTFTAVR